MYFQIRAGTARVRKFVRAVEQRLEHALIDEDSLIYPFIVFCFICLLITFLGMFAKDPNFWNI